jgi:hypothetical protein
MGLMELHTQEAVAAARTGQMVVVLATVVPELLLFGGATMLRLHQLLH